MFILQKYFLKVIIQKCFNSTMMYTASNIERRMKEKKLKMGWEFIELTGKKIILKYIVNKMFMTDKKWCYRS